MSFAVLSVSDLAGVISLAVSSLTEQPVWVDGEIQGLRRAQSGHVWFDLVEPGDLGGPPVARIPVVLFSRQRKAVNAQLSQTRGLRMNDGTAVRIRGRLDFYAPHGRVQLVMDGIDPTYTMGRLAEAREQVLRMLAAAGLLEANRRRPLTPVPLRVGLVTAGGSAAYADFLDELTRSEHSFRVVHADALVQGRDAEASVLAAIELLATRRVDVIAVVRGGGARADLAAFDAESVARAIATCGVPVFTGIGHETDRSVADEVAHTAHKTPTACAAAIVNRVRASVQLLEERRQAIAAASVLALDRSRRNLDQRGQRLVHSTDRALRRSDERITSLARQTTALDPARLLARGWSITRTSDGAVARAGVVAPGGALVTTLADGRVHSTVTVIDADPGDAGPPATSGHTSNDDHGRPDAAR